MARLTINDRRERAIVSAADALLRTVSLARPARAVPSQPARVLCFRIERIGDLLMTLPALAALRGALPDATIDLAVGSWNRELASAIAGISGVDTLDAAWLSRENNGLSTLQLAQAARRWRDRRYDLAINFEPDIRTNVALAATGARFRAGFASAGGGPLLDLALDYDVTQHTADNALALVRALFGDRAADTQSVLRIPDGHRAEAARLLQPFNGSLTVGIHVSGGRAVKQWPEERFRAIAERLIADRGASIVLTGTPADRDQIARVAAGLPHERVADLSAVSLLTTAAVIERLDLFVTGDTGPMHLAQALHVPTVAVFGPSDPRRYAPRGLRDRVVRIDLPCSPCNRIRHPPARCTGHTPACLSGIESAQVLAAIDETLAERSR
jgi:ADP-heptose:LPS heptosyltransferase